MFLDLSGVMVSLWQTAPSAYALRADTEFEVDAAARIAMADDALATIRSRSANPCEAAAAANDRYQAAMRDRQTAAQTRKWFGDYLHDNVEGAAREG